MSRGAGTRLRDATGEDFRGRRRDSSNITTNGSEAAV